MGIYYINKYLFRHLYHYAGWAELMSTEMSAWAPVGVVGAIVPWNFPLMLLTWKVLKSEK